MKAKTTSLALLILLVFLFPAKATAEDNPLTLGEAVSIALKRSPFLRAQGMEVRARKEGVKAAWGQHLPQMDLEAGYTRLSDPVAVVPIKGFGQRPPYFSKNIYEWKALTYFTLYHGGRISRMVDISRLEKSIGSYQEALTKEELVANVTNIFNRILQLKFLQKAQEDALKALEKARQDTENLLEVGRAAPVDLMRIDTQVATQKEDLKTTRELIKRTRETLAYLLGWNPQRKLFVKGNLVEAPFSAQMDESLISHRPDVKAAVKEVEEAEKKVSYEFGAHLPHVYLASSYGKRAGAGFHGEEEVWQAGLYVKMNLFSGGTISARVREAKARLLKAQLLLQDLKLKATQEILHSLSSIQEARARIAAAKSALESSRESFRIEKLKYLTGAGTVTDMLLSQAQWLETRARYYQALYDYHAALVAYRLATATILENPPEGEEK